MLIRTSGEHRLSDFLLWQCSNCYIHFDDVLWPELGFWNLFKAIFRYQQSREFVEKMNAASTMIPEKRENKERVEHFLDWMDAEIVAGKKALITSK